MNNKEKKGISLIILVITIISIIILASVIVMTIINNNPISQAEKLAFMSDVENFKGELNTYNSAQNIDKPRGFSSSKLQADENSMTYDGIADTGKNINDIIPLLASMPKYYGLFEVSNGQLVFKGTNITQKGWIVESGIEVISAGEFKVKMTAASQTVVKSGTDVIYKIEFSSNVGLTTIDLTNKIEVLTSSGTLVPLQSDSFAYGLATGSASDLIRSMDVTIHTNTALLLTGSYKLRIKAGSAINVNNISNIEYTTSLTSFNIDNIAPTNPIIVASPTESTNGNVTVTINYSSDSAIKQYSTNGTDWSNYTTPVTVSTNNTTVYAKASDTVGNQTGQSTTTIVNIDKVVPTLVFGTNGGSGSTASTTVTVSDLGGSLLNTSQLLYKWDIQNISTPGSGWATFANGATITNSIDGTYYLWIKASDNAGNTLTTKSNSFVVNTLPYTLANVAISEPSSVTSTLIVNSTITGQLPSYNNPIIPAGFGAINTVDASWGNVGTDWDKGLVIQDVSGNQFVWIPINGTTVTYAKWCITGIAYNSASISDDVLPAQFNVANITTTYKGFYIARYESMFDYNGGTLRAASKKSINKATTNWSGSRNATYNGYLWNFSNYTEAKTYSENMASRYGYDVTKVITNLITGAEWDTIMKWIQNSGKSVTDSRAWGNYSDSIAPANVSGYASIQISGYSEYWKTKNIYDIAGNAWEWTNEVYSTYRVLRSGPYLNSGSGYSAAYRGPLAPNTSNDDGLGFRAALFIL